MELIDGAGWQMKVADVYINPKKDLFYKCNIINCDAKCDSRDELICHINSKHCYMTNQAGAHVPNRRDSLLPRTNTVNEQSHGKDHFNPVLPPLPTQPPPPPPIPSSSAANLNDGRNNADSVGIPTPAAAVAAATVHKMAAHQSTSFISKLYTQKVEIKKMEYHSRYPYNCTICRKVFGNRSELERHKQMCSDKKHRCDICKNQFETARGKQGHERNIHANIFKYPCSECVRAFKRHHDLDDHKRHHSKPSIECDFCPKMFCTKFGKDLHIKKRHSDRRYHCKLCTSYSSVSDATMQKHYTNKHGGVQKRKI